MKNGKIKFLLSVLLFGSLWGLVEATLGTVLHLPAFDKAGIYAASSTIILPIAYYLMACCYKKTGSLFSVPLMGVIASLIKLSVAFVVGFIQSVYNPAIYIIVESLAMFGALAIFRPKDVLSLKTLGAIIVANTTYQMSYLLLSAAMGGKNAFTSMEAWTNRGENYLFKINAVAILYSLGAGSLLYGLLKLKEKLNYKFKFDISKIVYSPITAAVALTLAVSLTITFAAVF